MKLVRRFTLHSAKTFFRECNTWGVALVLAQEVERATLDVLYDILGDQSLNSVEEDLVGELALTRVLGGLLGDLLYALILQHVALCEVPEPENHS